MIRKSFGRLFNIRVTSYLNLPRTVSKLFNIKVYSHAQEKRLCNDPPDECFVEPGVISQIDMIWSRQSVYLHSNEVTGPEHNHYENTLFKYI